MHSISSPTDPKTRTPKANKPRPSARPYEEGGAFAMRKRYEGHDIYVSGCKTAAAAKKKVRARQTQIDANVKPTGLGSDRTTLAQALQDYAMARLPFMKGAVQEARRMNHYLRYARLDILVATPIEETAQAAQPVQAAPVKKGKSAKKATGAFFKITLAPADPERKMANGLAAHRRAQLTANADTEKFRAVLADTAVGEVTRALIQGLMDTMRSEGNAPATIALERSMLRVLYFYAFRTWKWTQLADNPATGLKMPEVNNIRKRVMSQGEQELLDQALSTCRRDMVAPVLTLLRETAMRSSEPLQRATWGDVNWERKVLTLQDSKSGPREVPLSPLALAALRELGPGEPGEAMVKITYESLRASWQRACERAGIEDLTLHDLRRTGATRLALKSGNIFLVQSLTGHKTLKMVERYVDVRADDVVKFMHAPQEVPEVPEVLPVAAAVQATVLVQEPPALPATAVAVYSLAQMEDIVKMTVKATLAGQPQPTPLPGPEVAEAAQDAPRVRPMLRVVR
jgi:integrase